MLIKKILLLIFIIFICNLIFCDNEINIIRKSYPIKLEKISDHIDIIEFNGKYGFKINNMLIITDKKDFDKCKYGNYQGNWYCVWIDDFGNFSPIAIEISGIIENKVIIITSYDYCPGLRYFVFKSLFIHSEIEKFELIFELDDLNIQ